uniref:Secreted protein n=1 Tax=Meloidogyne incognita TaxID=6306 RepID=A0A914LCL8_MELIC
MEILLKFFGLIQMIYLKIVAIYFLWNILGKRHFINVIQMLTRMPVVLFSANFQCFHQLTAVNHFLKVLYLSLLGKMSANMSAKFLRTSAKIFFIDFLNYFQGGVL